MIKHKTYKLNMSDPVECAEGQLKIFIDQLEECRFTTTKPDLLEWEIRLYKFMLLDPVRRLDAYHKTRKVGGALLDKREVVNKLGWIVP